MEYPNNLDITVLGLMSGTSLDGLDLALVHFSGSLKKPNFKILQCQTVPYPTQWKQRLNNAIHLAPKQLQELNDSYGEYLADVTLNFVQQNQPKPQIIASHGHTVFHKPHEGITLQIGNGSQIFKKTKIKTICNFRVQDVELGGQGAPLVPIGDVLLFEDFDVCVNLGGFANISLQQNNQRIAYDICPVNIVLNYFSEQLGLDFDEGGKIARTSAANPSLLAQLNQLDFYQQKHPKSLGKEWVDQHIYPIFTGATPNVSIATFTQHAAQQIARCLPPQSKVLITGGGAFNTYLIERISALSQVQLHLPDTTLIHYKEALIFALLGMLKNYNQTNCLASVTGAKHDHSSGVIYL